MKVYRTDEIRNVVLLGHGGSGKTSLVEAMLYVSGASTRMEILYTQIQSVILTKKNRSAVSRSAPAWFQ